MVSRRILAVVIYVLVTTMILAISCTVGCEVEAYVSGTGQQCTSVYCFAKKKGLQSIRELSRHVSMGPSSSAYGHIHREGYRRSHGAFVQRNDYY